MPQFVLDDQLKVRAVQVALLRWSKAVFLRDLRPGERIADDRVPEILRTLREPTFVTIDADFCERAYCHPSYCILFFDLSDDDQEVLPRLLRTLLRRKEARPGPVAKLGTCSTDDWCRRILDI